MAKLICPSCHKETDQGRFCASCGAQLAKEAFVCVACGGLEGSHEHPADHEPMRRKVLAESMRFDKDGRVCGAVFLE